jgi:tellurite resistance protein TehA-like permease
VSVRDLTPAYFGMAMATGIVSVAAHLGALPRIAHALYKLNLAIYVALWLLNAWRLARHPGAVAADFTDHLRAPGFFTWVAATGVLGVQCILLEADYRAATMLAILAAALWVAFTYGILASLTARAEKPPIERGLNGGWLLSIVATQSLAVMAALLAPRAGPVGEGVLHFAALTLWLSGGVLYGWVMTLIFYRYMFFRLSPADLSPPYWINMGAMAISTLAGALLVVNAPQSPLLQSLLPFVKGFTLLYWASATWWIPMLLVLGVWRYGLRRHPLRYDPLYWGAVFPLGMYGVATHEMALALQLEFLAPIPQAFLYAALGAWALAFLGWLAAVAQGRPPVKLPG